MPARRSGPHRFRRPPDPLPDPWRPCSSRANGSRSRPKEMPHARSAEWRGAERLHAKGERIRSAYPAIPQSGRCAGALRNRPRSSHAAVARRRARTSPRRPYDTLCCPCGDRSRSARLPDASAARLWSSGPSVMRDSDSSSSASQRAPRRRPRGIRAAPSW